MGAGTLLLTVCTAIGVLAGYLLKATEVDGVVNYTTHTTASDLIGPTTVFNWLICLPFIGLGILLIGISALLAQIHPNA